jgi:hypothetical protein
VTSLTVRCLPGDEHRHHDGLARSGRHLQGRSRQRVVVSLVLGLEPTGASRRTYGAVPRANSSATALLAEQDGGKQGNRKGPVSRAFSVERAGIEPAISGLQSGAADQAAPPSCPHC